MYELSRENSSTLTIGYEYLPINRQILDECLWKEVVLVAAGTPDNFLDHGIGIVLISEGDIACEAYGLFKTANLVEIGAITRERFRKRGLCTLTAQELIRQCHLQGLATTWTCDGDNLASQAVAKKLGYQVCESYKFVASKN